jgi:hypothetical protein
MKPSLIKYITSSSKYILIFLVFVYVSFLLNNSRSKLEEKIIELQIVNKQMTEQKQIWGKANDSLKISIELKDVKLRQFEKIESEILNKLKVVNNQINNLNVKYEKANNFTYNYNSDSVKQYFSNLK